MEKHLVRSGWLVCTALLLLGVLLLLAGNGATIAEVLQERVLQCLQILVPSLFACMVAANLMQESGSAAVLGQCLRRPARRLGWSSALAGIFLISQLAGYPVGALLLRELQQSGQISRSDTQRMACVCFGGGPSFAVGLTGAQVFGSAKIGWYLWGCCLAANLCAALCIRPKAVQESCHHAMPRVQWTPKILTDSVSRAMASLWGICGIVLLFGVLTWLLQRLGMTTLLCTVFGRFGIPSHQTRLALAAVLDVTQLPALCRSGLSYAAALPIAAGLLSFGGICVLMQCSALGGRGVSFGMLLCVRGFAGILAAGFSMLMLPAICENSADMVFSVQSNSVSAFAPLPAVLIFLSGFPLLLKKD